MIGYQERASWMGTEVLTLADVVPAVPRAMIVGLNPAPTSVDLGHYYQGNAGQRQLRALAAAGLFEPPRDRWFEDAALTAGVGFTDIVKRPTSGESGVSKAEVAYGSRLLADRLSQLGVPLVICVFRHPVKALLGSEGSPGMQVRRTAWGAQVFRMPGPYEKRENADRVLAELTEALLGG